METSDEQKICTCRAPGLLCGLAGIRLGRVGDRLRGPVEERRWQQRRHPGGPEADRYLACYRVRAHVTPVDGRITQQEFMKSCQSGVFMAKAPEAGAPIKGANSFTEGQAKDRIVAAGFTSVSSLAKDGDGVWRGSAMKDGKSIKVAVDFKGNVVSQ
jgi:putative membrane protein